MSVAWSGHKLADALREAHQDAVVDSNASDVWIDSAAISEVILTLRDDAQFRFDLLSSVTAVDWIDHFELVYHLTSLPRNATAVVKSKCGTGRREARVPSVVDIWRGADLQEREVWDLMGIVFEGHPNHKRIMLWEGFPGHPLRKDFATYEQSIAGESELSIPAALAAESENVNGDGTGSEG